MSFFFYRRAHAYILSYLHLNVNEFRFILNQGPHAHSQKLPYIHTQTIFRTAIHHSLQMYCSLKMCSCPESMHDLSVKPRLPLSKPAKKTTTTKKNTFYRCITPMISYNAQFCDSEIRFSLGSLSYCYLYIQMYIFSYLQVSNATTSAFCICVWVGSKP